MSKKLRAAVSVTVLPLLVVGLSLAVAQSPAAATPGTPVADAVNPLANPPTETSSQMTADAQVATYINNERAARNIAPMTVSPYLQAMAQAYVDYEMSLTAPPWASGSPETNQYDDIGGPFEANWQTANPCTVAQYGVCPAPNSVIFGGVSGTYDNIGSDESGNSGGAFTSGDAVWGLMRSTPHRNKLLAPGWSQVGAGAACVYSSSGDVVGEMIDVLFGSASTAMTTVSETPATPDVTPWNAGVYPCPLTTQPPTTQPPTTQPPTTQPTLSNAPPLAPIVDMASTPSGNGYWLVDAQGYVSAYGNAANYGGMGGHPLNAPISHIVSTPDGKGYWLVAADGGVFSFGDAQFYGSMGGKPLNAPVMDIIPTANGGGYWLVATDGGIFSFGNARFYGSMGGHPLNAPVNGGSFAQGGYRMVANDGGIFDFGGAQFYGSMGGHPLNKPIVGMADTPDGAGYWLVASDGGIFSFGDARFYGSTGGTWEPTPAVGMAVDDATGGYWIVDQDGQVFGFGAPTLPLSG